MHEVDARLILSRQILFAKCFNSTKGLTINHSAIEEKAKDSRMMAKRVYSCHPLQENIRISQLLGINITRFLFNHYMVLVLHVQDGPPKS